MRFSRLLLSCLLVGPGAQVIHAAGEDEVDRIIFPHALHVEDMGMECGDCHEDVETSTRLTHDLLPVMDQCLACHDGDTAPEECALCHTRPEDALSYGWQPTEALLFPHQPHVLEESACRLCHPAVSEAEALTRRHPPGMGLCIDCHDTPLADNGCYLCHASLEGKLPASHGLGWTQTHGLFIHGSTGDDCAMCHQQTDCEDCHAQAQFEKVVHPANYEFVHAGDFLSFEKECSTCHAMPQECQSCHLAKGVMPLSHNSPGWAFLPPGDGGFHALEALDKPDYCLTCHEPASDATCQRCHGL